MVGARWLASGARGLSGPADPPAALTVRHATTLLFIVVVGFVFLYFAANARRCSFATSGSARSSLRPAVERRARGVLARSKSGDMSRFTRVNGSDRRRRGVPAVGLRPGRDSGLCGVGFTAALSRGCGADGRKMCHAAAAPAATNLRSQKFPVRSQRSAGCSDFRLQTSDFRLQTSNFRLVRHG